METTITRSYRRLRREGYPAAGAYALAKRVDPYGFAWDSRGNGIVATVGRDGFQIRLRAQYDDNADASYLGTFTRQWEDGAIRSHREHAPSAFQTERWFVPGVPIREHAAGLRQAGYSRHAAWLKANEYVRRDMERAAEYTAYIVTATACREGIELGSDSLGGTELGDDEPIELAAVVDDYGLIDNAIAEAREALARLCAS